MKKALAFSALAMAAGLGMAQDFGNVLSSTPVIQQVAVPRQVCTTAPAVVQQPKSGAGALIGAVAGGILGHTVGGGGGKGAATVLGAVGGAVVGDKLEGRADGQVANVQQCSTQTFYENRTVAYNVLYEYAGKQYSTQMPSDPGQYVRLQITPVGPASPPVAMVPAPQQGGPVSYPAPTR